MHLIGTSLCIEKFKTLSIYWNEATIWSKSNVHLMCHQCNLETFLKIEDHWNKCASKFMNNPVYSVKTKFVSQSAQKFYATEKKRPIKLQRKCAYSFPVI